VCTLPLVLKNLVLLFNTSDYSHLKRIQGVKAAQEFAFVLTAINCCFFRCFVVLFKVNFKHVFVMSLFNHLNCTDA